jgi:glutamate--cysteine ligase
MADTSQQTELLNKALIENLEKHFEPQSFIFSRGVERETLRVDAKGQLSEKDHPTGLGSKLTHPLITTDFSEAQLELITPVSQSIEETIKTLNDTHRFVYHNMDDEILWASSMPCVLRGDKDIPLARYGGSNLGKLKTTYRNGLSIRYGRSMQTICAVHYNFSFSDSLWQGLAKMEGREDSTAFRSGRYFDLMRNFRRFSWLAIYLTGASPAVCKSFVKGQNHNLQEIDEGSLSIENATSLRNGDDLGYKSVEQSELIQICYNSLDNYISSLAKAITTPVDRYTEMSKASPEPVQVNDNILQSEAEFYTTIRAKRVPPPGTNFLSTLKDDGVQYIEVRLLDVNPYQPLGVDASTMRFIDTLLLHCLLTKSPAHDEALCRSVDENVVEVVSHGRDTSTLLVDQDEPRTIHEWGKEVLDQLMVLATFLDKTTNEGSAHQDAITAQIEKIENADLTPSGKILSDMEEQSIPFYQFSMNQSLAHKEYFLNQPLSEAELAHFNALAAESIEAQVAVDSQDKSSFDSYLKNLNQEYRDLL